VNALPFGPGSPVWLYVQTWARGRIEALHLDLEASLGAEATEHVRGQITALRDLLNLVETDTTAIVASDPYEKVQL